MTTPSAQPKVLKVGVVVSDQLAQEVVFDLRQTITIGRGERALCRHAEMGLDLDVFDLFVWRDGAYYVRFLPGMKGGFTSAGEKVSIQKAVKQDTTPRDGDAFMLALGDDDKGKVEIGPVTILFRFVEAPAPAPVVSTKIPDFRPRLVQDADPVFSGFLALFGALGLVFGVWVMNTERPEITFASLDERFTKIDLPKPVPPEAGKTDEGKSEEKKEEKKEEEKKEENAPKEEAPKPVERSPADMQRSTKEIARDNVLKTSALFQTLQANIIGTSGANGVGTTLLQNATGGIGDVAQQLKEVSAGGNYAGAAGIRGGAGTGGDGTRSIGDLGDGLGGTGSVRVEAAPAVKVPKPSVAADQTDYDGGDATGVKSVVRSNKGSLLFCHEQALKKNPKVAGKIVVGWTVSANTATDVYIIDNTTDDRDLETCVVSKIRRWKFIGVEDGGVKNTFVFQPKEE